MARVSTIVTNFQAGEFSPRLEGRIDLQKYNSGAQKLENMLIFPQGGITRRPGTKYAGTSKGGGKVRLIDFQFSDEQAYVLEFGANYIRFFKDGGLLTEATETISAATQANPVVLTITGHSLSNGDRIFVKDVGGMVELNNREFTVANATTNTIELSGIDGSGFTAYTSGGTSGKIVEVTTTYTEAQVFELNHVQSADVLYLAHKDHEPAKLTRATATSFTLTDIDFVDGPWLDENTTDTTMYASAATGSGVTITASADVFSSDDVGRFIRFREILEIVHDEWAASTSYNDGDTVRYNGHVYEQVTGSTRTSGNTPPVHLSGTETYGSIDWEYLHDEFGHVRITGFTSATVVTADVHEDQFGNSRLPDSSIGAANANKRWSLGAFGGDQGYPRAVAFYEERLYFAGTTGQPQTIFGSQTADFENMTPGTNDDDAINVTIASDQVNVIKHMIQGRFLQLLTTSAEFTLSGGTGTQPVTPTNVNVLRETTFGSSDVRPIRAGSSTILIQKGQEKVKEVTFDLDTDGLVGRDLTILAEHIARGGLTDMIWQQEPELILWFVRTDGTLIGLSYDPQNQTIGWHTHPMSNSGIVESITAIPSGAEDQVYLSVKRTIDGSTVRHIVFMENIYFGTDVTDAFYVDSGLTYDDTATTTISGLNHLEGETVQILADGAAHADKVVSGGVVTLDRSASTVHVGYSYDSKVQTLRLEGGADDGVSQGKIKRIHGITVRFLDTVGAEMGPDENNLDRLPFRDSSMAMDEAVPMFDGDKEISFPSGYDNDARVFVRQTQPLPMTILAVMRRSNTFDA
jgi:hypothetical protein